jgi:hypothetical protein
MNFSNISTSSVTSPLLRIRSIAWLVFNFEAVKARKAN